MVILQGNSLDLLAEMEDNSIDAVVTDPPYGLGFMGKKWDSFTPKEFQLFCEKIGKQLIRVLKPGAWLLAFGGTRTYHRLTSGLEDAGFAIKDCMSWNYGSGYPKNYDVSKAIDKKFGKVRKVVGKSPKHRDDSVHDEAVKWDLHTSNGDLTEPASDLAKRWDGYGTALKPSWEPIVMAQKPYDDTYANNIQKWGCGAINIDGCRVPYSSNENDGRIFDESTNMSKGKHSKNSIKTAPDGNGHRMFKLEKGRWPANSLFDPRASSMLDDQSGDSESKRAVRTVAGNVAGKTTYSFKSYVHKESIMGGFNDSGGASRFFYCPKASTFERNVGLKHLSLLTKRVMKKDSLYCENCGARKDQSCGCGAPFQYKEQPGVKKKVYNNIVTLKPINLMRYLVRLVTPPNGTLLDCFAGSGSTGCACEIEGIDYILIEKREHFAKEIIPARLEFWSKENNWLKLNDHPLLPGGKEKLAKDFNACEL